MYAVSQATEGACGAGGRGDVESSGEVAAALVLDIRTRGAEERDSDKIEKSSQLARGYGKKYKFI